MADKEKRQGTEQAPPAADAIKKQIPFVQFSMDFMRDPEDALFKWGYAETGRYERWYRGNFEKLVAIVAQATGADPEQIADKDIRSPEQQRLLTEAAAHQMIARMDAFFKSVYMDAVTTLEPMQGEYPDPAAAEKYDPASDVISVKEQAVLYFFAAHDEITPTDRATLTDAQRDELKGIFSRLDAFYMERTNGGEITPEGAAILLAFIEKENPAPDVSENSIAIVQYKKTTQIKTITDKLANVFFSLMAPASSGTQAIDGQRQMTPLRYECSNAKKEITLFYDYVFDEEILQKYGIAKKFDDFDFLVMSIIDNLYSAGNELVSYTKIYYEMGGEGSPTSKQLEPIYYSLLKGMTTTIMIDDAQAQEAWKAETKRYNEIVSPVMPVQLGNERLVVNGKLVNGFVRINNISPFMQVAKPLGHLTAWDKDVLRLYKGRKTKRYYSVMRFLIVQIGWMRNGNRSRKIKYDTLYKHTGDTTTRAQQLARDMMYRLLDEVFIPTHYVKSYKEEGDPTPGVKLTICKNRQALTE